MIKQDPMWLSGAASGPVITYDFFAGTVQSGV